MKMSHEHAVHIQTMYYQIQQKLLKCGIALMCKISSSTAITYCNNGVIFADACAVMKLDCVMELFRCLEHINTYQKKLIVTWEKGLYNKQARQLITLDDSTRGQCQQKKILTQPQQYWKHTYSLSGSLPIIGFSSCL